jgi:predicted Zn-dependent protease with MMP-like domain
VDLHTFERHAREDWARIPPEYRQGVDGVIVRAEALRHPELDDVFTMGECITEAYPSDFGSADTIRSSVVLYYGSFVSIAKESDDFDWAGEIWETLTHELQHHLESLAQEDGLGDMDYAADENFKRCNDEPFDPFFYREGEALADGVYRVESEYFVERDMTSATAMTLRLRERDLNVSIPDVRDADVAYITLVDESGPIEPPQCLVLVRRLRGWRALGAMLRPRSPVIFHAEGLIT